ncbi:hypothetical protein ACEQ8H_002750 [Pleosporales sp. CAS-2024a]
MSTRGAHHAHVSSASLETTRHSTTPDQRPSLADVTVGSKSSQQTLSNAAPGGTFDSVDDGDAGGGGPRMDGGITAWVQVFVSFLMAMNSFGYVSSFGLFQSHWETSLGNKSSLDISWVGSLSLFLIYFLGSVSGPLMDAGYFRLMVVVGCACQILGAFATSAVAQYWQLILAQGVVQGFGNGLLFTPCIALVSTYFAKRRGLALALTACGAPVGGIVFPVIARQVAPKTGYPWTIRTMGFVLLFNSVLIISLARPRSFARKGPLINLRAFRDAVYSLFAVGIFFTLLGLYIAYFYVSTYGKKMVHIGDAESLTLLIILNCGGIPGRIIPAYLADRYFGVFNTLLPFLLGTAVLLFGWVGIRDHGSYYAFAVLYGIFANAVQTLFPTTLTQLSTDMSQVGARVGMVFTLASIACLIGPPVAGRLIDLAGGTYLYAQLFAGVAVSIGFLFLSLSRWCYRMA